MKKLKTLKDLEEETYCNGPAVRVFKLKAEAIKWVKYFEKKGRKKYGKDFVPMNLWRHFFNLIEEDFK